MIIKKKHKEQGYIELYNGIKVPIVDKSKGQYYKRPKWHRKMYGGKK